MGSKRFQELVSSVFERYREEELMSHRRAVRVARELVRDERFDERPTEAGYVELQASDHTYVGWLALEEGQVRVRGVPHRPDRDFKRGRVSEDEDDEEEPIEPDPRMAAVPGGCIASIRLDRPHGCLVYEDEDLNNAQEYYWFGYVFRDSAESRITL